MKSNGCMVCRPPDMPPSTSKQHTNKNDYERLKQQR